MSSGKAFRRRLPPKVGSIQGSLVDSSKISTITPDRYVSIIHKLGQLLIPPTVAWLVGKNSIR